VHGQQSSLSCPFWDAKHRTLASIAHKAAHDRSQHAERNALQGNSELIITWPSKSQEKLDGYDGSAGFSILKISHLSKSKSKSASICQAKPHLFPAKLWLLYLWVHIDIQKASPLRLCQVEHLAHASM
jgi:hypothetical protein